MWRRTDPPALDGETVNGIISLLMRIDANVQTIIDELTEEGSDEETES